MLHAKKREDQVYRIHSIRSHSYYLFHCPILCSVYSRVATNWEWCSLISVSLSLVPRLFPHFQCILDTVDEAEESHPFADIEEDEYELENKLFLMTANYILLTWASQATPHLQYCCIAVVKSHGLSMCARATWSLAVATIQEWPVFLSAHLKVWLLFESGN